jgi:AcrR family transcriptional regulator
MTDGRKKKRPGLEEQQQLIIKVAVVLFLEQGTQAVSIAQICSKADISRPTFYRCFKDKESLLAHVYATSVNKAVVDFIPVDPDRVEFGSESFRQAFEVMYDAIFADAELACLLFRESNDPNSPAYNIVNQGFEQAADVLLAHICISESNAVNRIVFKSIMAANQWIVHDAINKGLSPKAISDAKAAGWALVTAVFNQL